MNKQFLEKLEKEDPEFWEYYKTNKYHFYWNACINPDSISEEDDIEWAPYEREDNIFLEFWYQQFLKGEIHTPSLGDYVIDFHGMLQYHNSETWRQRAIVRELPEKVKKVKRNSRFDKNYRSCKKGKKKKKKDYNCYVINQKSIFFAFFPIYLMNSYLLSYALL